MLISGNEFVLTVKLLEGFYKARYDTPETMVTVGYQTVEAITEQNFQAAQSVLGEGDVCTQS